MTIAFYRSDNLSNGNLIGKRDSEEYLIKDNLFVLELFKENSSLDNKNFVKTILSNKKVWGKDLTEFKTIVNEIVMGLDLIEKHGAYKALEQIMKEAE